MISLLFHRAFLWFMEEANQWEKGMSDYFGEGLMPWRLTFTRCQVIPATSVSCTSRSSRTVTHLSAFAMSLPREQPWEGSSSPEGLWSFLTVITTDSWVPGSTFCCLFLVGWGGDCVGRACSCFSLGWAGIVKFKEAYNFKSEQWLLASHCTLNCWRKKCLFLWNKDKGWGRWQRIRGLLKFFLECLQFQQTFWSLKVKVSFW